ncbi:glycosyltransferase [Georgenia sp. AZ-5]|uniref:glycosyltransferase n=1 Tax=Georgenia sp. AZ-5 TaxID=3367526 RepID=UPI00375425CC
MAEQRFASSVPARPSTLAVVVSAGVSAYLPRTLAALARQRHLPDVVLVVDVVGPGKDLGTGVPVHEAVAAAGLEDVTRVRVVNAPEAGTFGEAVRQGLVQYVALVERAAAKARKRGYALTGARTSWSGVTGELNPVTTGEIRAVGAHGAEPDRDAAPDWLWLLHDDSAPDAAALDHLLHAAESGRSIAVLGAKQRDWDEPSRLLEVGLRATRSGRRLPDIEPGEIDQGQHDHREDVLAVGTAGALVRRDVWQQLGGTDPALGPFGDGLDLSRRARLAGHRVVVVPTAIVYHARASYLGLRGQGGPPALALDGVGAAAAVGQTQPDARRSFPARRRAQVYNALLAAPAAVLPLLALGLLVLAPLRALWRVATKELTLAGAELTAVAGALRPGALWRARRAEKRTRRIPARSLAPLEATGKQVRRARRDARRQLAAARRATQAPSELEIAERAALARRRRITLAALALVLVAVSLATFLPVVLGGALTGGALLPADAGLAEMWRAARSGWVPAGDGAVGPADPLLQVLAVLMLLVAPFGADANALVAALVLAAIPLAGVGAWFAAGAATRSVALRAWAALVWALAPSLLLALGQGRLGAVLAHLALPWVALGLARTAGVNRRDVVLSGLVGARRTALARAREAGGAAAADGAEAAPADAAARDDHRVHAGSIAAAAGASLALAVAAAGAPVLLPAAIVLVVLLALVVPRRRRWVLAVPLPALALLGPLLVEALRDVDAGSWRLLLADPGAPYASVPGPSWLALLGWPVAPPAFPGPGETGWVGAVGRWALLAGGVTLVLAALAALLRGTGRARAVRAGWLVAVVGLAVTLASSRTDVALGAGPAGATELVRGWPGTGVSLVVLGLLVAAVAGADGLRGALGARSFGWAQVGATALSVLAFLGPLVTAGGWAVAARQGYERPTALLAVEGRSAPPVPAVAAEMQDSPQRSRALALTPVGDTVRAEVWRDRGPQLTETSAAVAARDLVGAPAAEPAAPDDAADAELAQLVAGLSVGAGQAGVADRLGAHAIGIVIVPPEKDYLPAGTEPRTAERRALVAELDATAGLERITENASGAVWRVARGDGDDAASSVARARVVDAEGEWVRDVDAGAVQLRTVLPRGPEGRTLVLAERADAGWRAWYDGRPLRATSDGWRQAFELPAHTGTLTVRYEAPLGTAWAWLQGGVFALAVLLALPIRRRRTEVE